MHRMTVVGLALAAGASAALVVAEFAAPQDRFDVSGAPVVLAISRGHDLVLAGPLSKPADVRLDQQGRRALNCGGVLRLGGVRLGVGCASHERVAVAGS